MRARPRSYCARSPRRWITLIKQGVVHRDVKPSNVLLQDGKWALLMDFGVAKSLTSTSNITASGTGVGTPDYMSPEQAQGLPIDQRTDIYSLGIMLYQMLTGEVPFHAETPMAVMLKQIVETPSLPHLRNPSIRTSARRSTKSFMKALAKSRDDRYAHAVDLPGLRVGPASEGDPANVARPSLPVRSVTPSNKSRRSPWPIVAGIAIVLIAVIAVVALVLSTRSSPASLWSNSARRCWTISAAQIDQSIW